MSHRGHKNTAANRERKRKDAQARQSEYDSLTIQQKLDRLPPPPHADRQRQKLMAQLDQKHKPLTSIQGEITLASTEESPIPKVKDRSKQDRK